MSLASILGIISLFVLIVVMIITIVANYSTLKSIEDLSKKQCDILMILINARTNKENSFITLEKIEKVLVPDLQSNN